MKLIYAFLLVMAMALMIATSGFCAELVAAYSFDDGSSKMAKDDTGNGHDGEIKDANVVNGKFGKALEFDGSTSQVEIPTDDALNFVDGVSVEAWVNPSSYNALSAVAQKWGDTSNRRQYLLCFVVDKLNFYISGTGASWPAASGATAVATGEWTHIAGTYDIKSIKAYVNGELDAEIANTEGLFGSDLPAWIGGYGPDGEFGDNRHFPGIVDEVRYWDGALSADEVEANMDTSVANMIAVDPKFKLASKWGLIKKID